MIHKRLLIYYDKEKEKFIEDKYVEVWELDGMIDVCFNYKKFADDNDIEIKYLSNLG